VKRGASGCREKPFEEDAEKRRVMGPTGFSQLLELASFIECHEAPSAGMSDFTLENDLGELLKRGKH